MNLKDFSSKKTVSYLLNSIAQSYSFYQLFTDEKLKKTLSMTNIITSPYFILSLIFILTYFVIWIWFNQIEINEKRKKIIEDTTNQINYLIDIIEVKDNQVYDIFQFIAKRNDEEISLIRERLGNTKDITPKPNDEIYNLYEKITSLYDEQIKAIKKKINELNRDSQ